MIGDFPAVSTLHHRVEVAVVNNSRLSSSACLR
jgi:hypothetical protein